MVPSISLHSSEFRAEVEIKFIMQQILMHSINKQLYLVSRCIKLKTSLPSDCIMERLIQTIVELSAFVSIYMNTQYAYNVKINEKAY